MFNNINEFFDRDEPNSFRPKGKKFLPYTNIRETTIGGMTGRVCRKNSGYAKAELVSEGKVIQRVYLGSLEWNEVVKEFNELRNLMRKGVAIES